MWARFEHFPVKLCSEQGSSLAAEQCGLQCHPAMEDAVSCLLEDNVINVLHFERALVLWAYARHYLRKSNRLSPFQNTEKS